MFNIFKKKESVLTAPVSGTIIPIEEVPDQVFAQKMMGDGVAFQYNGMTIASPCNGTVKMIAETKHAIGITTDSGADVLIHIGLDTVALNGEGFEVAVSVGDKVTNGQTLITVDRELMQEKGIDLTTPMVVTNGNELKGLSVLMKDGVVTKGDTPVVKIE
ncbi:PTS sugar transporter subunit IIA [Enterococcus sp. AZ109]|uniref:PTS sugar transporter subunit IIA n=1 Tax=Enterococcus sp. AZ109 TaxID=2774634 RepID=UPI003F2321BC